MKLMTAPARTSHAIKAITATTSAVAAASAPKRVVSPFAMSPRLAPMSIEIADVTVMAVWRELQKSHQTTPPKRHA